MLCNNHDDLLHLSFVLKISLFLEASLEPSRASKNQKLTILPRQRKIIIIIKLCQKYLF